MGARLLPISKFISLFIFWRFSPVDFILVDLYISESTPRPDLGPIQPPVQWLSGLLLRGKAAWGVVLTTQGCGVGTQMLRLRLRFLDF
jgi:hypothetical protein